MSGWGRPRSTVLATAAGSWPGHLLVARRLFELASLGPGVRLSRAVTVLLEAAPSPSEKNGVGSERVVHRKLVKSDAVALVLLDPVRGGFGEADGANGESLEEFAVVETLVVRHSADHHNRLLPM